MHSFFPLSFLLLGATVATDVNPRDSALQLRQGDRGPVYECHADCGYTIENANQPNYCSNSTWKDLLEDCLECAETYDIWKDYGDGVSGVAKACGITPKPSPASSTGGGGSTTAGPTGSSATSNPSTTTGSAPGSSSTGSGSSASGSSGATTTPAPSTTGDASGSGSTSTPSATSMSSLLVPERLLSLAALGFTTLAWLA